MSIPFSLDQIFTLSPGVVVTQVDGESVLLDSSSGQYFGLNDTGTQVLNLIEKQIHFSEICEKLTSQYPENQSDITIDVSELISSLLNKQLIKRS